MVKIGSKTEGNLRQRFFDAPTDVVLLVTLLLDSGVPWAGEPSSPSGFSTSIFSSPWP